MTDLTAWLLDQITEDERCAESDYALGEPFVPFGSDRLEAECDAKRRIVEFALDDGDYGLTRANGLVEGEYGSDMELPGTLLKLLALPYADRAGYRKEWRP